ncbi:hypothetical protein FQA39_LY07361 [Lamprigera yunnana]|nr:hypothetical protein FQA39_LY07361 [Lamprigera yunnana]
MWMLYAEQYWTKAIDLKSAVERLFENLGALEFDADHEAIYGMERYYTTQQCEQLRDKYKIGWKDTINKYIEDCSDLETSSSSDEEECKAVEQNGPSCSEDVASDLSDYDVNNEIEEVESDIAFVDNLEGITAGSKTVSDLYNFREVVKEVGKYVVVNYEGTFYLGKITKILDEGAVISTMQKSLKSWKWPTHEDAISYSWDEVIGGIDATQQISKRVFYNVPELNGLFN